MRPLQLKQAMMGVLQTTIPPLAWGPPGVGKTDLIRQIAGDMNADLIISHPVVEEPIDAKGLPRFIDLDTDDGQGGVKTEHAAEFVPFGTLRRALNAKKTTIWFLDDLGQAVPGVQAAYMQLLLGRRVNGHILPDCVRFVAASNRQEDRAGAHRMITPLLNRFVHYELEVNAEDWQAWALANGIDGRVRSFLAWKPDALHKFDPKKNDAAFPTPRSWEFVSKAIDPACCAATTMAHTVAGCVGQGAAAEFMGFVNIYQQLPDVKKVLADPANHPLPDGTEPSVTYALSGALVEHYRRDPGNLARPLAIVAQRIAKTAAEFSVLTLRDAAAVDQAVLNTAEGQEWLKDNAPILFPKTTK